MKRRYPAEVMQYRDKVLREQGIELSPEEAEVESDSLNAVIFAASALEQISNIVNGETAGTCTICGKTSTLRYGCCSPVCYIKMCDAHGGKCFTCGAPAHTLTVGCCSPKCLQARLKKDPSLIKLMGLDLGGSTHEPG